MNDTLLMVTITCDPYGEDYDPYDYQEMDDHVSSKSSVHTVRIPVLTDDHAIAVREAMSRLYHSPSGIRKITVTRFPIIVPSKY